MLKAIRYHDISCGHKVTGHESKCAHLHGHNYRIHFVCEADELDHVGRVIDFDVIKKKLCLWVEELYDHKFLVWIEDSDCVRLKDIDPLGVHIVSFNPTAENIAKHLVLEVAPPRLIGSGVRCVKVIVEETRKCSASYELEKR